MSIIVSTFCQHAAGDIYAIRSRERRMRFVERTRRNGRDKVPLLSRHALYLT